MHSCLIDIRSWRHWPHLFISFVSHYYRPKRSFGQGNIFTPVCHSVHRGGVPARHTPPAGTPPPGRHTPPGQVHPPWQVHPPGRYTPPGQVHPPPREQQTPEYGQRSAGTHPTGMHSCSLPCRYVSEGHTTYLSISKRPFSYQLPFSSRSCFFCWNFQ